MQLRKDKIPAYFLQALHWYSHYPYLNPLFNSAGLYSTDISLSRDQGHTNVLPLQTKFSKWLLRDKSLFGAIVSIATTHQG